MIKTGCGRGGRFLSWLRVYTIDGKQNECFFSVRWRKAEKFENWNWIIKYENLLNLKLKLCFKRRRGRKLEGEMDTRKCSRDIDDHQRNGSRTPCKVFSLLLLKWGRSDVGCRVQYFERRVKKYENVLLRNNFWNSRWEFQRRERWEELLRLSWLGDLNQSRCNDVECEEDSCMMLAKICTLSWARWWFARMRGVNS